MERSEVYKLIDSERDYQNTKFATFDDADWNVNDWIVFIERYIQEAKDHTGYVEQTDSIRKIAALAVACMEYNKTYPRVQKQGELK